MTSSTDRSSSAASLPPADLLQRYLRGRLPLEVLAWTLFFCLQAGLNTATVMMDWQRSGRPLPLWQVASWEWSSNLVLLALVPLALAFERRKPLHIGLLRRHLPWHLAGSLVFSLLHVALMVAIRIGVYQLHGEVYRFGAWHVELAYEYMKDARSYALLLLVFWAYRLLLWRLQGEASLPERMTEPMTSPMPEVVQERALSDRSPAVAAPASSPEPRDWPERFLVKKLGQEFLLPTQEIEWIQACGNYVNLHRLGHDYPLRSTLAAIEGRLDPQRFVRVHRSYLVNIELIQRIEPTEAGDARLHLRGGAQLPCSRRYREALRGLAAG